MTSGVTQHATARELNQWLGLFDTWPSDQMGRFGVGRNGELSKLGISTKYWAWSTEREIGIWLNQETWTSLSIIQQNRKCNQQNGSTISMNMHDVKRQGEWWPLPFIKWLARASPCLPSSASLGPSRPFHALLCRPSPVEVQLDLKALWNFHAYKGSPTICIK